MVHRFVIVRHSARKHGIVDEDIVTAASTPILAGPLDDENPQRILVLGIDTDCLLELVILVHDDETEEVIHAMPARRKYLSLLP